MFEWKYTNKQNADPVFQEYDFATGQYKFNEDGSPVLHQWKSYDNKWVRRHEVDKLPEMRLNEILNSFGKSIDPMFEMNIPPTWWCDIETEVTDEGFPDPEEATTRINTISMTKFPETIIWARKDLTIEEQEWVQKSIDEYSKNNNGSDITKGYTFKFRFFPTEKEMLEDFIDFITPVTAISGWNFLGFDWLYIYNRCKTNNIDIEKISPTRNFTNFKITPRSGGKTINVKVPMHKIVYDYLLVYKTWDQTIYPKENNTLDFVAEKALGIKKVNHPWGFKEFFEDHYKEYVFYNCIDTILVEHIDRFLKTSEIWYMLACELRLELNVAFSTIQPTHVVMCNFVYPHYKVVPEKKKTAPAEDISYEGAFVWPTRPGIFKYIGGLDFASLYPSIMRQFQISPESFLFRDVKVIGKDEKGNDITVVGDYVPKADEIKTCSGAVYKKDPDAVVPAILTHYFALRKAAKWDKKIANTEYEDLKKILEKRKEDIHAA